jgi:hypothetical protein
MATDDEDYDDGALVRVMLRCAACALHEYADSTTFDHRRDIEYIRKAVNAATHLNAIVMNAKEVT